MKSSIEAALRQAGCRVTAPRLAVFAALHASKAPQLRSELCAVIPEIDGVTVYRTIDLFLRLGLITSSFRGWKPCYELAEPFRPHHHHMMCSVCGRAQAIHSEELETLVAGIARAAQFEVREHHFELAGVCSVCRYSI